VRSWQVPDDVDIPIMAGEFHFGAVDRGVPSPGLSSAWDQRQRGLAFTHYLASALADPEFVEAVSRATKAMYRARSTGDRTTEQMLEALIAK